MSRGTRPSREPTPRPHELVREVFPSICTLCGNTADGTLCQTCRRAVRREYTTPFTRPIESPLARLASIPRRRA